MLASGTSCPRTVLRRASSSGADSRWRRCHAASTPCIAAAAAARRSLALSRRAVSPCCAAPDLGGDTVPLDALGLPGQDAIVGVTVEEAQILDSILSAGAWEDVQGAVRSFAMQGALSPGVLAAARKVLAKSQADPTSPPEMVASLTAVTDYLEKTFELLERMRPKAALAEALTELDPDEPVQRVQMEALMRAAFAPSGGIDQVEFMEDIIHFCNSADEQDAEFVAAVAEGRLDLQGTPLADVMAARRQGRTRMAAIADMATNMAL